jgi:beta-phosphoglucomutase family hydrolase
VTAFIFDIDGTIIDSMPAHNQAWTVFFARHGRTLDDRDFFQRTAGRTATEVLRELFGPVSDTQMLDLVNEKDAVYRELFGPVFREVPGFTAFARAARAAGLKLACATAGRADNIAFALAHLKLEDFFDVVVGGHEVGQGKPAPDLFLLAARRMHVAPAQCVVFEDAPFGIEGARRAGMLAVALTTGMAASELAGAHVIAAIADYSDVTPNDIVARADARRRVMLQTGTGT